MNTIATRTLKGLTGLRVIPSENDEVAFVAKWTDANGKPKSKAVTFEAVRNGATADIAKGTLTLPEGKRGRKAAAGMSQDDLNALLASIA